MGKGERFSDMEALQLIVDHCNKVEAVVDFLGKDFQKYEQSWWLNDIISMNILQIGERIHSNLTQDFKDAHPSVPWGDYIGVRNRFAHQYFTAADEIVWETAMTDIPMLSKFCVEILKEKEIEIPEKEPITANIGN